MRMLAEALGIAGPLTWGAIVLLTRGMIAFDVDIFTEVLIN